MMLVALERAFDMWMDGMDTDKFPLKEDYWHVGTMYDTARSNLMNYTNGEGCAQWVQARICEASLRRGRCIASGVDCS